MGIEQRHRCRGVQFWGAVCLFSLTIVCSAAGQQTALDLKSALGLAESSNLELRAARQQRAIALAGLATARQLPNPAIGFTAARDTPHEGITFDLPIELGGQRGKRIAVAREEQKASGNRGNLDDVIALGREEMKYLQGRVDQAQHTKDTEAAVNLGISARRLLSAVEDAQK